MLIPFFMFLELLLHEFSHLCSYDRMMAITDWADPQIHALNIDYHLHDEFIARVRGTEFMLRMVKALLELDLIYSLYVNYVNDVKQRYLDRMKEVKKTVWDEANWQALCHRHHSMKTRKEDNRP